MSKSKPSKGGMSKGSSSGGFKSALKKGAC